MMTRPTGLLALATLGLVLAAPVQAAPNYLEGSFVVAKRDRSDDGRQDVREHRNDERRSNRRDAERDVPPGYGYGYERRQQERSEEGDRHPRDRR
ncbi:MAG: hypothetical protein IV085_00545 [Thiobacillus sp.]|nr:hypothetical protein [Thiobacillus sp.]